MAPCQPWAVASGTTW